MKRMLAITLVLIMALSLLPMSTLAAEEHTIDRLFVNYFVNEEAKTFWDITSGAQTVPAPPTTGSITVGAKPVVFSPEKKISVQDADYYLAGIHSYPKTPDYSGAETEEEFNAIHEKWNNEVFIPWQKSTSLYNDAQSVTTPGVPQPPENPEFPEDATLEEVQAIYDQFLKELATFFNEFREWYDENTTLYFVYAPHAPHTCEPASRWYGDKTNHWQLCKHCWGFMNMNWHSKDTGNGKCTVCENELHYYTVTLNAAAGGKVDVSKDKALLNDRIDVTVTPDAGYKIKNVAFYCADESHLLLTCWDDGDGKYHTVTPTCDVEVVVEFEAAK